MKGTIRFLLENSIFLVLGALGGLIWANVNYDSFHHLVEFSLGNTDWIGTIVKNEAGEVISKHFDLHYIVNDILMAFFFAIAGKEVWEATLPGGPLSNPKKAATPLIATLGGMVGPALLYVGGAAILGKVALLGSGWAIPCATDIAFSYMVARIIFGAGHPAIPFLLLLAIADDALGLIIIAVFYPQEPIQPIYFLVIIAAVLLGLFMRRQKIKSFWWYLLGPGAISWFGFLFAGIHPALGLLPIIPTMPHAHVDTGLFDWVDMKEPDTLNAFEHWWKNPVELILCLFGLFNAGVPFSDIGTATWLVLLGLLVGKPLGIWVTGWIAAKPLGFGLPEGMNLKDLLIVGCAAGIGFTVALFVAGVAFAAGDTPQAAAKMGALFSFGAVIVTFVVAKIVGVEKVKGKPGSGGGHH